MKSKKGKERKTRMRISKDDIKGRIMRVGGKRE